jgi:hypothetical protein
VCCSEVESLAMTRLRRMLKTLQLLTLQLRVTPSVHSLTEGPF